MTKLAPVLCISVIALCIWHTYCQYHMGRALVMPSLLAAVAILPFTLFAVLTGVIRAAHERSLRMLALTILCVVAVYVTVTSGRNFLHRGMLDRIHASVSTAELLAFAAPYCTADDGKHKELKDQTRWPKWLVQIDPGEVSVRPICSGPKPTCYAVHIQFGGGLLGHWGVAVLPGTPPAKPYLEELEPGVYWADGP